MSLFPDVVRRSRELNLISVPGVSTAEQALAAVAAGADIIKVFPVRSMPLTALKQILVVARSSPAQRPVIVAGGVEAGDLETYALAGASGFAVGEKVFVTGLDTLEIGVRAREFMRVARLLAWTESNLQGPPPPAELSSC